MRGRPPAAFATDRARARPSALHRAAESAWSRARPRPAPPPRGLRALAKKTAALHQTAYGGYIVVCTTTLDQTVKQRMEMTEAACKGSFRTCQLRSIQKKEDWCVCVSAGVGSLTDLIRGLKSDSTQSAKRRGLSSLEAQLGSVGAAYTRSGIVLATDGSLKRSRAMGATACRHAVWRSFGRP